MIEYFKKSLFIMGPYKHQVPLPILFFIVLSLFDLLGISLIFIILSLLFDDGFKFSFIENFIDISQLSFLTKLSYLSFILFILFSLKFIISVIVNYKIISFCNNLMRHLRVKLLSSFLNQSYESYTQKNSSEYLQSIFGLTSSFSNGIMQFFLKALVIYL